LSDPTRSPILLAPLAKAAGGWGLCDAAAAQRHVANPERRKRAVAFATKDDPDYRKLLTDIRSARDKLMQITRFDMPDFRPTSHYVREMKRFGILSESFDLAVDRINVYDTDRRYWKSLWHVPRKHE